MDKAVFEEYGDCIAGILAPMSIRPTALEPVFHSRKASVVVFDIYGTLLSSAAGDVGVDGEGGGRDAFYQAMADGGWIGTSWNEQRVGAGMVEEAIRAQRARRIREGIRYPEVDIRRIWLEVLLSLGLYQQAVGREPESVVRHRIDITALSYECRINPVWPMPHLAAVLDQLVGMGVTLGVLSNAQFYTPVLLETLLERSLSGLGFHQDLLVWSYRVKEGKPSQALYVEMNRRLKHLGILPEQVVYVGNDMRKDILPAKEVGWCTVLFAGDERSLRLHEIVPDPDKGTPDMIINDLQQLVQLLW